MPIGVRRVTDHKLLGALLGIPLRRRKRQMARIATTREDDFSTA